MGFFILVGVDVITRLSLAGQAQNPNTLKALTFSGMFSLFWPVPEAASECFMKRLHHSSSNALSQSDGTKNLKKRKLSTTHLPIH